MALAEHRRVVREACGSGGGVEVDTQGDAFFVAFPTAPGAIAAARAIAEALRPGPMQVRLAVHTGTPLATDEGYVGPDVHRAARIAAAGHGGQVLVSASTATLTAHCRSPRSRRAPAEGSVRARAHLSTRRRRIPAAPEPVPDEPARAGDPVSRPRARAPGSGRAPLPPRYPSPDADGARGDGKDAPRRARGCAGLRSLSRGGLLGPARRLTRPRARPRVGDAGGRGEGRPCVPHRRQAPAPPLRQLRARVGGCGRSRRAPVGLPQLRAHA